MDDWRGDAVFSRLMIDSRKGNAVATKWMGKADRDAVVNQWMEKYMYSRLYGDIVASGYIAGDQACTCNYIRNLQSERKREREFLLHHVSTCSR